MQGKIEQIQKKLCDDESIEASGNESGDSSLLLTQDEGDYIMLKNINYSLVFTGL